MSLLCLPLNELDLMSDFLLRVPVLPAGVGACDSSGVIVLVDLRFGEVAPRFNTFFLAGPAALALLLGWTDEVFELLFCTNVLTLFTSPVPWRCPPFDA